MEHTTIPTVAEADGAEHAARVRIARAVQAGDACAERRARHEHALAQARRKIIRALEPLTPDQRAELAEMILSA